MIEATVHQLVPADMSAACIDVRTRASEKFGAELVDKHITPYDWSRISLVADSVSGAGSLLDIGVGHGLFINIVARLGTVPRLVGIDIQKYKLYTELFPGFETTIMDAEVLSYADDAFDVVTCMEVIEHLPDGKLERVLAQLRRVAAKRLIVSVPFCEPLPLPKYHQQQFTAERILSMFPTAKFTLFLKSPVTRVPWMLIDEQQ